MAPKGQLKDGKYLDMSSVGLSFGSRALCLRVTRFDCTKGSIGHILPIFLTEALSEVTQTQNDEYAMYLLYILDINKG